MQELNEAEYVEVWTSRDKNTYRVGLEAPGKDDTKPSPDVQRIQNGVLRYVTRMFLKTDYLPRIVRALEARGYIKPNELLPGKLGYCMRLERLRESLLMGSSHISMITLDQAHATGADAEALGKIAAFSIPCAEEVTFLRHRPQYAFICGVEMKCIDHTSTLCTLHPVTFLWVHQELGVYPPDEVGLVLREGVEKEA